MSGIEVIGLQLTGHDAGRKCDISKSPLTTIYLNRLKSMLIRRSFYYWSFPHQNYYYLHTANGPEPTVPKVVESDFLIPVGDVFNIFHVRKDAPRGPAMLVLTEEKCSPTLAINTSASVSSSCKSTLPIRSGTIF